MAHQTMINHNKPEPEWISTTQELPKEGEIVFAKFYHPIFEPTGRHCWEKNTFHNKAWFKNMFSHFARITK